MAVETLLSQGYERVFCLEHAESVTEKPTKHDSFLKLSENGSSLGEMHHGFRPLTSSPSSSRDAALASVRHTFDSLENHQTICLQLVGFQTEKSRSSMHFLSCRIASVTPSI